MKKRLLYYEISKYVNHKNAIVITGMRQVGKTTLMRQIFESLPLGRAKLWFDFDNPLEQKIFEDVEYNNIYRRLVGMTKNAEKSPVVFIDEIQSFPPVTKVIKYLIDHYGIKFFVTGSSNFYLKNLFPESLAGRKFLYHLSPLNFQEFLYFKGAKGLEEVLTHSLAQALRPLAEIDYHKYNEYYFEYLRFGGFPEVVTTNGAKIKQLILKNIFASFFEKDLKILSDYKDARELRDLILLLVPRVGSGLEVSKLASELGVGRPKIYSFLDFLEGTFFIRLLPKFSKSIDRSVAGGKKIYFTDTGILNTVGKVNDGQLLENAVANQLAGYGSLGFYRSKTAAEIDFILNKRAALEVKLSGDTNDVAAVRKIARKLRLPTAKVISRKFRKADNIIFPHSL